MGIPENINLGRKGRFGQVNINAFKDGVKKTDIENKDHVKIFDKFDKDKNGVLSEDELQELVNSLGTYAQDGKITRREAGKFLKNNGLKGELKKKEVFDFLKQYGIASDNIADTTSLLSADGIELLNIEYNPNDAGETITEMINQENGALYGKKIVKDGKTVTQYFSADGKVTKETFEENGVTTIKNYDENGNVTSTIRKKGSVTEYLNEQGQITRKETDKGGGIKETIDYEYDDSGNLTKSTTTNPDGSKVITEGQTVTTLNTDGSKTVENSQTGITQEFDKDGNIIKTTTLQEDGSKVVEDDKTITTINTDGTSTVKDKETGDVKEFDKEGKPVPYKHQTQLGDTWYGIVQAKYGITDHNQTMEIVHRLKRQNNVDFNATNMPQEILLPDTVTLKDGTEVKLANKDAKVDTSHNNITNPNHSYNLKTEPEDLEAEIREQAEKNEAVRKEGTEIAAALYKDMKGIGTSKTFSSNLERITKDNAAAVVLGYREVSNDESLTEAILDEVGMSKSNRREALQGIFNKLVEKAKEQGIDTTHFEEQFNSQINSATTWGSDKFDPIFEGLASGINGASILTSEDITDIQSMSAAEQKDYAVDQLDNVTESSRESFENQLATDGWAGKTVDWMSGLWGSENRKKFVEEDLKTFEAQVDQLRSAKTEEEFKTKFKEIFGTEFNPNMIRAYEKRQNQLVLAKATYGIEQNFNTTVKNLLENDTLSEEYQYVQTSSGQYGSSGSYIVSATKEQVFARDFNAFAEFVGQGDIEAGKAELNQAMADAGLDLSKATQEEKYTALHNLAKTYSQTLHNNTLAATENKGFDAFNNECETMYNAAFGTTNDIARRVQDYNTSQQVGAMVLKSGVKAAGAIGLCLIPGVGLVAASVGTAAISATVDASDRMSSKIGLQEGELREILKNATIDGATVFAGGQLTKALSSASSFVKMGGQMTGDIIVGAAAEKLQTGQITLGGVAFQTVFSGAGNLVALKQLKNVDANAPKADIPPEVEPLRPRDIVADGEVARNIDVSHVDANQRRMVQDAVDEVPSEADIIAYRKSLGEAPTPEEQALIDVNNAQAAAANAKAHQIGENLSDDVIKRLLGGEIPESVPSSVRPEIKKLTDEINGIDGTIKNLEQRIQGAKRMHKDTQALETQLGALQQRRTAKLAELETAMKDVPPVPETPVNTPEQKPDVSKPVVNNADDVQAIIVAQPGERLVKSAPVAVEPDAKLVLADQYELDLASSEISARLRNLKEGETLTVGRTGDIQVPEYMTRVSRNHLEITKQNGEIIVKDVSSNGTKIKDISVNNNIQVLNPVDQSIKFNQTHKVPAGEKVLDGYKDGGRGLKFDSDGNPINAPTREIIVVNRQKDKNLQEMISDIKKKTAKMSDKEKAAFLQKYIYAKTGKGNVAEKNCNAWDELNIGREVLLGDIITNKPPVAVCRHRSLLYKILGDEIGLKVELQRGNFINEWGGGGHAWNTVRFDDGTSAIFDAMHNKTSNTTPGHVDDYAKYYFTVKKQPLYENGL